MPQLRVTPLEIARLRFDLREAYALAADGAAPEVAEIPVQAFHLALPDRSVLVDAPAYVADATPEPYRLPAFVPPPPLTRQLSAAGIDPAAVTDVIITHAHFDHVGALAAGAAPRFPGARHYLGRGDWEPAAFRVSFGEDLLAVERAGLLTLVEGDLDLGGGLELLTAPGESPGHTLVRARLGGDVAVVAGDLYHHPLEFARPHLDVRWVDRDAMRASKQALMARARREGARVYFSHIHGPHRVVREGGELRWLADATA